MAGFGVAPPGRLFVQQLRKTEVLGLKNPFQFHRFLDATHFKQTVWKPLPLGGTFPA
jgi:hypothetical protein